MERTPNESHHTKLTLEKKILLPLLPGFELATFRSRVRRSNQQAIPATTEHLKKGKRTFRLVCRSLSGQLWRNDGLVVAIDSEMKLSVKDLQLCVCVNDPHLFKVCTTRSLSGQLWKNDGLIIAIGSEMKLSMEDLQCSVCE